MSNRQQRRLAEKKRKAIAKQICLLDKSEEHKVWFQEGFNCSLKACYAGIIQVLNERGGVDQDELVDILQAVDNKMQFLIGQDEAIEEAFDATGIFLDFNDPLERIRGVH